MSWQCVQSAERSRRLTQDLESPWGEREMLSGFRIGAEFSGQFQISYLKDRSKSGRPANSHQVQACLASFALNYRTVWTSVWRHYKRLGRLPSKLPERKGWPRPHFALVDKTLIITAWGQNQLFLYICDFFLNSMRELKTQPYRLKLVSVCESLCKALTSWLLHIWCVLQPQALHGLVVAGQTEVITLRRWTGFTKAWA